MKIFSSDEIAAIRRYTLKAQGLNELQFIDRVGESFSLEIISETIPGHKLVIFAGPELNGAYALATARHLCLQGIRPTVYLFNIGGNRITLECAAERDALVTACGAEVLNEVTGLQFSMPNLQGEVTVIDGIFGTERTTPLSGGYKGIVRYINETKARIIALDVPSGMIVDGIDGMLSYNIIHATLTLAIGTPRVAFFMRENAELLGKWKIIPVDFNADALKSAPTRYRLMEKQDIKRLLPQRDPFESKADAGDAFIVAGSYGMLGAAVLAAQGALHCGCGKVTIHGPRCGFFVMQSTVPCALYDCDEGDTATSHIELKRDYSAVAIGPGIGQSDATLKALGEFLKIANANSRPLVLDADALNCMWLKPDLLNHIPVMSILTPHVGEFDRMFGRQPSSYARLLKALEVAEKYRIIIILKGRFSTIVMPDGKAYFNPTGTPAMATGGSGDVLTGVLAALIARGLLPEYAALIGTYVHGLAGELAAADLGTYGVTASDIAKYIGRAIKSIIE